MLPITSIYGIFNVARCLTFVHELYWRRIYNGTEIPFKTSLSTLHLHEHRLCAHQKPKVYTIC